jgi:predicted nucleotidyltransferase
MDIFNDDFRDFIQCLNTANVEYILVGGYAVILRGYSRSTGDMDIWVNRTDENYQKLLTAAVQFGLPAQALARDKFFSDEFDVFSFGRPPFAIEIMTAVKGLAFDHTFRQAVMEHVDGIDVRVIHLNQLIEAKKASGRNKDLNDIENLPSADS